MGHWSHGYLISTGSSFSHKSDSLASAHINMVNAYKMFKNYWSRFVKLIARLSGLKEQRAHHFYPGMLGCNSLVVDLGAHKGEFAQFITSEYECSVLGLEANTQLFQALPTLPRVKFLNLAINREDAPIVFHVSENPEASSVFEDVAQATGGLTKVSVEGITLDSLLKKHTITSVDLLKVDIESAEFQMLELASEETLNKINQITVEFHVRDGHAEYSADRVLTLSQRLERLGFRTFVMDRKYTDVLFLRTSRIPWHFTERLAMAVYRFLVMPAREIF